MSGTGSTFGGSVDSSSATPHTAASSPTTPPTLDSTRLSTSSCRSSRAAARAQRGADRHLLLPLQRAREQQVGDVGADDEQHEADRAEQHQQRRAQLAADEGVGERDQVDAPVLHLRDTAAPTRAAIVSISACAGASVTPGLSRPTTNSTWFSRISFGGSMTSGTQMSPAVSTASARGAMPTTV